MNWFTSRTNDLVRDETAYELFGSYEPNAAKNPGRFQNCAQRVARLVDNNLADDYS